MSPRKASGRGERTRTKLLDAARAVFAERGFAPTRVDDIVARAGTSHGTFYLYFANRDDILQALAEQTAAEARILAASFDAVACAPDRRAALRAWIADFFVLYRRDWAVLQAWIEQEADAPELDRLGRSALADVARAIASAIRDERRATAHATVAATALVAMLERFAYFWIVRDGGFREPDVLDTLSALVHGAVFADGAHPRARRQA